MDSCSSAHHNRRLLDGVTATLILLAFIACGCGSPDPNAGAPLPLGPGPEVLLSAASEGLRVEAIVARSPYVAVVWVNGASDVFAAVSDNDGATFPPGRRLSTPERRVAAGRSVSAAFLPVEQPKTAPLAFVSWVSDGPDVPALQVVRSTDGGGTFAPVALSGDVPNSLCAPEVLTPGTGRLIVKWNDCREGGVTLAALDEHGRLERLGHVPVALPDCVRSGVAIDEHDVVHVVWPAVGPDGAVTMMTAVSSDGARSFVTGPRTIGDTQVPPCHDIAGAVAADEIGSVHVSWSVRPDGSQPGHVVYQRFRDGTALTPRQPLDTGVVGVGAPVHPRLLSHPHEGVVVVWEEVADGRNRVVLRQMIPSTQGPAQMLPSVVLSGAPSARQPVLAKIPGGVIVAWTKGDGRDRVVALRRIGLEDICLPRALAGESKGKT